MMYTFLATHDYIKVMNASDLVGVLYEHELSDMLPHFSKCMEIFVAIPASSCSAERSFSCLGRLKTYLRNTMSQPRLKNIALINIERQYANRVLADDMDKIINIFGRSHGHDSFFFLFF